MIPTSPATPAAHITGLPFIDSKRRPHETAASEPTLPKPMRTYLAGAATGCHGATPFNWAVA